MGQGHRPILTFQPCADLQSVGRIPVSSASLGRQRPYWELLFHRWFLNMVSHWRGVDKMHANNTSPILVGRQGTHKSTLFDFSKLYLS